MKKIGVLQFYFIFSHLLFGDSVYGDQVHTFQLERDDKKLNCGIVFPKETFLLLEPIIVEAWVKNISTDTMQIYDIEFGPWLIQDEKGNAHNHTLDIISFRRSWLGSGDSTGRFVSIGRFGWQLDLLYPFAPPIDPYLPAGYYKAYCKPDTIPFYFKVTFDSSSKNHLRRKKFLEFVETNKSYRNVFDTTWGVPTNLEAPSGTVLFEDITRTSSVVETAYKFFGLNKTMFGITNPRSELKVYKVIKGNLETEVDFKQFYRGLETSKDYIILTRFTPEGKLKFVYGTFYPDINLSTIPRISKSKALETAKYDLDPQGTGPYRNPGSPSLMVFPYKGKYYLAWFIFINQWRYLIDANDGNIIHKEWIHPSCIVQ